MFMRSFWVARSLISRRLASEDDRRGEFGASSSGSSRGEKKRRNAPEGRKEGRKEGRARRSGRLQRKGSKEISRVNVFAYFFFGFLLLLSFFLCT